MGSRSPAALKLFLSNAQTLLHKKQIEFKKKHKLFNATQATVKSPKSFSRIQMGGDSGIKTNNKD